MSSVKFFGQFLLERARISNAQLLKAVDLQAQANRQLGALAVEQGLMSTEDAEQINRLQRTTDKRFGDLAVERGLITEAQVEALLSAQKRGRLMLGEALVQCGFLTDQQLAEELHHFKLDQQETPVGIADVYKGRPQAKVLAVFGEVFVKFFQRVAHLTVKPGACYTATALRNPSAYSILQRIQGDLHGMLCINVPSEMVLQMAEKLLGEEIIEVNELALDGAAEFLNIISGNICAKLGTLGYSVEMTPPEVKDGTTDNPVDLAKEAAGGTLVVTPLAYPEGVIELCVVYRPQ